MEFAPKSLRHGNRAVPNLDVRRPFGDEEVSPGFIRSSDNATRRTSRALKSDMDGVLATAIRFWKDLSPVREPEPVHNLGVYPMHFGQIQKQSVHSRQAAIRLALHKGRRRVL